MRGFIGFIGLSTVLAFVGACEGSLAGSEASRDGDPAHSADAGDNQNGGSTTTAPGGNAAGSEGAGDGSRDGGGPSAMTCDDVTACVGGDGCCPSGCDYQNDLDCVDCTNFAAWPAEWNQAEADVLAAINVERASPSVCRGDDMPSVEPVTMDEALQVSARCHALDMALQNYAAHRSLDGRSFGDRARDAGFSGPLDNENIAFGQQSPQEAVTSWMGSSTGHCEAIMNPSPRSMGIGYVDDPEGSYENVRETDNWPFLWVMVSGTAR
ncbi:MAG: CAP domain-containing protein [Myxococcota bacterium]